METLKNYDTNSASASGYELEKVKDTLNTDERHLGVKLPKAFIMLDYSPSIAYRKKSR